MTKLFDLVGFVATLILRAVQGAFDVRNAPDSGAQADTAELAPLPSPLRQSIEIAICGTRPVY